MKKLIMVSCALLFLIGCAEETPTEPEEGKHPVFLGKWFCDDHPVGVAVAPNGYVYVIYWYLARGGGVAFFTPTGNRLGEWSITGDYRVYDIDIAQNGNVYAIVGNEIRYYTPIGSLLGKWGSPGSGEGEFYDPDGVAIAPNGNVYVLDSGNGRVQYFTAAGSYLGKWGGVAQCSALAVAPDGNVYVSHTGGECIKYFTPTGSLLGRWGSEGSGEGQFKWVREIAVNKSGWVFVADRRNFRIQFFTATGDFLGKWGTRGTGDGQFENPYSIAIAPDEVIYVADEGTNRVQYFR
ncbi:MAG: 6-bladed beta-propeller [candidate division Zixibacteria bacterium]|nr:6-bladed beta-propeller [candidate division Zixibacteria bacterium]